MQNDSWRTRTALSLVLGVLLLTIGCGTKSTPPNTYLYVGGATNNPADPFAIPIGSVAQFRVESDGTLTALSPQSVPGVVPYFASAVTPGEQYLFIPSGPVSEFEIGSDGTLSAMTAPVASGGSIAFTPNGQFALLPDPTNATLNSYSLSASGVLSPINTVPTSGYSQYVTIGGSGKFAYVSDLNDGTILEYTISAGGMLAANGSIFSGGHNPNALVFSPGGFLYSGNTNSGSVSVLSMDASTGLLALVDTYTIFPVNSYGNGLGAVWIAFDPAGTHAYVSDQFEIVEFTVDASTGALTSNGVVSTAGSALWGGVDPTGKFLFTANSDGTISRYVIGSSGTLSLNGSVSVGVSVAETLAFAQR